MTRSDQAVGHGKPWNICPNMSLVSLKRVSNGVCQFMLLVSVECVSICALFVFVFVIIYSKTCSN